MEIDSGFIFNKSEIQNLNTQPRHSLNYENDKTTLPYLPQRLYNSNGNNNRKTHFRMALFVAIKKVIVYRKNCHWAHRFICTSNFGVPFRRADKLFIRYARWSKNQRKTYVHNACVSNLPVFLMPINAFIQLQFTGAKKRSASSVWITAMSAAWHFKSSHRQQNDPKKCSMNRWEAIVWCLWFHATEFPFSLTAIESIWIHSYVVVCVCDFGAFSLSHKMQIWFNHQPHTHSSHTESTLGYRLPPRTGTGCAVVFLILLFDWNNYSLDIIFDLFY